jgi:hypothetical protein
MKFLILVLVICVKLCMHKEVNGAVVNPIKTVCIFDPPKQKECYSYGTHSSYDSWDGMVCKCKVKQPYF